MKEYTSAIGWVSWFIASLWAIVYMLCGIIGMLTPLDVMNDIWRAMISGPLEYVTTACMLAGTLMPFVYVVRLIYKGWHEYR